MLSSLLLLPRLVGFKLVWLSQPVHSFCCIHTLCQVPKMAMSQNHIPWLALSLASLAGRPSTEWVVKPKLLFHHQSGPSGLRVRHAGARVGGACSVAPDAVPVLWIRGKVSLQWWHFAAFHQHNTHFEENTCWYLIGKGPASCQWRGSWEIAQKHYDPIRTFGCCALVINVSIWAIPPTCDYQVTIAPSLSSPVAA